MKDNIITRNIGKIGAGSLLLVASASNALATAGAVETAMTSAVSSAQTAGENILVVAAGVLAAFLLFKLGRRAANKA